MPTSIPFQGVVKVGSRPANGNNDIQFRVFTAATGGTQSGTTVVNVGAGIEQVGYEGPSQVVGLEAFHHGGPCTISVYTY